MPFGFLGERLARRALNYVEDGKHPDIIADIEAWSAGSTNTSIQIYATSGYARYLGGKPDQLVRHVELCKAVGKVYPADIHKLQPYKKAVSADVRILLDFFRNSSFSRFEGEATTFDDIRQATHMLGGSDVDIMLYSFPNSGYAPGFSAPSNTWKDVFSTATILEALGRLDTKTLSLALPMLKQNSKLTEPEALPFLIEQLSESSSKVRDAAQEVLLTSTDREALEKQCIEALPGGNASKRACLIKVLGLLETPTAKAAIEAHRETEKTQSVLTVIDMFLDSAASVDEVDGGYIDCEGKVIELPAEPLPIDDGSTPLGDSFLKRLEALDKQAQQAELERYEGRHQYWVQKGRVGVAPTKNEIRPVAEHWLDLLNSKVESSTLMFGFRYQVQNEGNALITSIIDKLPLRRVLDLACCEARGQMNTLLSNGSPFCRAVQHKLAEGDIDLLQLAAVAREYQGKSDDNGDPSAAYIAKMLQPARWYTKPPVAGHIWHLAVDHLPLIIEALPPHSNEMRTNLKALNIAADFPSLPQVLVTPVLFAAIDPRTKVHTKAQAILRDVPGIDEHLIGLLDDKRQGVRANTARFLAQRNATAALPVLAKRLKKEKSELAKAEMISAVSRLGGDTTPYLGKDALMKEAETLVAKLPNAKIEYLELNAAPPLYWADGAPAAPELADAWLRLALKLKSPLGTPLFDLYLEQMTPESAQAFCDWVLSSWIGYDAHRPAGAEVFAKASERAKQAINSNSWMAKHYSEEELTRQFAASMSATYLNSGADSKGILALTHKATPETAGPMIATYLKQHGKRVSQAKAMVETLFGMGSGDAVQVLVATATRFKQRTVRELAGELVAELAEARGWTEDQLADRSVATGGFDETGIIPLPIGEDEKPYMAQLGDDLSVQVINPNGKAVKSLPAGKDEHTKASKALLSAAKKTVKTVTQQQAARLYEAMLTPRAWPREDWIADLSTHPIMKRLIERLVWRGLSDEGAYLGSFRMTPEGEF
ncbi:MAG: DUF4132 domain-containing protein, partial [Pseudomonadota bacterium]